MTDVATAELKDMQKLPEATVKAVEPVLDGPLAVWASEARQAYSIAVSIAKTSFVPAHFQDKPHEVTAAILAGKELGLEPMSALRSITVIKGTPALTANAMRGLVQSRGHEVWVESESSTKAVVKARREGEERIHTSEWTLDRAKSMGLTSRDNWQKQPQAMLVARATSEACRRVAADALIGMPYSAEELADVDGDVDELKPKRRRRQALPPKKEEFVVKHDPEPDLEDGPPPVEIVVHAEPALESDDE
jgi:hypothetical protein